MSNEIKQGQSYIDKVVELTGDINNAFAVALANGVSITGSFSIGDLITDAEVTKAGIVSLWNENNRPATALTTEQMELMQEPEGIGFMSIEGNFIVF